jgi:excisionase family DNA binding protein
MAISVFAEPPAKHRDLLTVKEVADRLRVNIYTIYDWAASGRLSCIRLSKRAIRFRAEDIANYERTHTTGKR